MSGLKKKFCYKCEEWKTKREFHKSNSCKDGRHTTCKPCRIAYNTPRAIQWKKDNPERYAKTQAAYRARKAAQ